MISRKKIQRHFDNLAAQAAARLEVYEKNGESEALHQFRVKIKKLRSILNLYAKKPPKKQIRPVKDLFRSAGTVRLAGIHLDLFRQFGADKELLLEHASEYNRLKAGFRHKAGKYREKLLIRCEKLRDHFEDLQTDEVIWRFLERIDKIRELLRMPATPETRHEARKVIKELIYAYALTNQPVRVRLRLNIPYLDDLQEIIGSWHDTVAFREWLNGQGIMDHRFLGKLEKLRDRQQAGMERALHGFSGKAFRLPKNKKGTA